MKDNIKWDQWVKYDEYEKQECDIKLRSGEIVKHVYPNAGYFEQVCGKTRRRISEEHVSEIMYRKYYQDDICEKECGKPTF
ncbi:MAG: hypothetical protein V4547_18305 [Bacteroidota bacterium]